MEMWRFVLAFLFLLTATECQNLEKSASYKDDCGIQSNPTRIGALPFGRPVYGVEPVGDEIYVIRDSTPYIEVYHRSTFQPKRNITVPGMRGPYDMVQSSQSQNPHSFLFIADWYNTGNLFRVQVPHGTVSTWPTGETAFTTLGLARSNVYTNGDIIVTASVNQTIKKLTVSGNQLSEFTVSHIRSPRQSIQVRPTNRYAVCYGYGPPPELHRVCLVNDSGVIDRCYGCMRGSGIGQLDTPGRLELVSNGCILVADTGNQRVVSLTRDLEYVRDLITGINSPYRMFFDENEKLLYVAANKVNATGYAVSGRVVVYRI